ncbi:MAG: flavodoxin family protein [Deltaproteobacteria bacterium]|nr:flavodoxin family protein [Deltaproteobacteria bacterium]
MTYDMTRVLVPMLLLRDALVLGSPVFFNNVPAQLKAFTDRTWSIKGNLKDKIGGAVVVGRRDGAEGAITAIHTFFWKHEMIPANRASMAEPLPGGEITEDGEALESAKKLCKRIMELQAVLV